MKKVALLLVCLMVSWNDCAQSYSREEIESWLVGKIKKYNTNKNITFTTSGGEPTVLCYIERKTGGKGATANKVNLDQLSTFNFSGGILTLTGDKMYSYVDSTETGSLKERYYDYVCFYMNLNGEHDLQVRMTKALYDLMVLLKSEKKPPGELY